jgi:glycosyltransferase involved in cell wall biosynthesis
MNALRILIVAEHASKRLGGEAILPYHYFRILRARGLDAFLIVHERTRDELTTLFPLDVARIHFIPDQLLQKLFYRTGLLLPRRLAEATFGLANQLLTQLAQRRIVRALATPATVVHQPIPVSPRFPSLLSGLGAPLIVGPLNGGMEYPPAFRSTESLLTRLAIPLARALSDFVNTVLPGKRRAALVLVANARTRAALPKGIQGRVVELPENAVDLTQWHAPLQPVSTPSSTFLFIGRLVDWKALDLALHALVLTPGASLSVIGDGPMLAPWRALAASLGLAGRVHFHGWLSQPECAVHLQTACALILPSLYECGGAVVLEAMAMGRPVIATAWGGPADYLDATCGILIPPTGRNALISALAQAMATLRASPDLCARMGTAGRIRLIEHFDWEKKIDTMLALYASVLPS